MKKLLLVLAVVTGMATTAFSQYYYIPFTNNPGNPGGLCTDAEYPVGGGQVAGWTSIDAGSHTTPVWTSQQTIPFSFNFNGNSYTNYYASTSGVVTFSSTPGTVPPTTNVALPSASIPDNSVMWWGLEGSGTNDNICYKTFGTAPNRQYWILYSSYSIPNATTPYIYMAVVLEETSNNIYLVDMRNNNTAADLTAGLQINSTTAYMVAGSPALAAVAASDPTPADNNYYQFVMGTLPANEIVLNSVSPVAGTPAAYGISGANATIGGVVFNGGSAPISQFTAKYSDGTTTWSDVINCNIPSFGTYTYTNPTTYAITTGDHPLTVWVEMPNDNDLTNNNGATTISGVVFMPDHNVVVEEATGTWCGWCVRGIVFMDSLSHMHPNDAVLIAVHNADPMTVTNYDAGVGAFISGFPSVLVDRKEVVDPSAIIQGYDDHINDFGFADLSIVPTFNASAGTISASVSAHFATNLSGDYRLAMVVTEDDCHGTDNSTWGQHNYYSGGANGVMGGFENLASVVPAADMYYDWVARSISGSFNGQTGSLPSTIVAGDTHSFTFNYIIPVDQNPSRMTVNGLLINATTGQILNGTKAAIVTGVPTINGANIDFNVYPNPASNMITVSADVTGTANTSVTITDMLGRTLQTINAGEIGNGSYTFNFDLTSLASGIYFANVMTDKGVVSKKFIKE